MNESFPGTPIQQGLGREPEHRGGFPTPQTELDPIDKGWLDPTTAIGILLSKKEPGILSPEEQAVLDAIESQRTDASAPEDSAVSPDEVLRDSR